MKVSELIEDLSKYPLEAQVFWGPTGEEVDDLVFFEEINDGEGYDRPPTVVLDTRDF